MDDGDAHSVYSSFREKVIEHIFVGDLLRYLWCSGVHSVEILRSEVDGSGYDLVVDCNGVLRHIQIKASGRASKTSRQNVNIGLAAKPSGCVVWILFDENTLNLGPFRWFGGLPGAPLPPLGSKVARHTKGDRTGLKAERPNIRTLPRSSFQELPTMERLVTELFGPLLRSRSSLVEERRLRAVEAQLGSATPTPNPPPHGGGERVAPEAAQ